MPGRLCIYNDSQFKDDISSLITKDYIPNLQPFYNIAPTHAIPVLLNSGVYITCHFGFIPSWIDDKKTIHVNARNETIFEKNSFKDCIKTKRCIIPINGYYEWIDSKPQFIHPRNSNYFALAGIYNEFYDKDLNQIIITVALITCEPNEKIKKVHHRMPVILNKKDYKSWLQNKNIDILNNLFQIYPNENMSYYEVSKELNKVGFDNKTCINKHTNINTGQLSLF